MVLFDRQRKIVCLVTRVFPLDLFQRQVELKALRAARLRQRGAKPAVSQSFVNPSGDSAALDDRRSGAWVEVEDDVIGWRRKLLAFLHLPQRNMQFEGGEIRRPDERWSVAHDREFDRLVP